MGRASSIRPIAAALRSSSGETSRAASMSGSRMSSERFSRFRISRPTGGLSSTSSVPIPETSTSGRSLSAGANARPSCSLRSTRTRSALPRRPSSAFISNGQARPSEPTFPIRVRARRSDCPREERACCNGVATGKSLFYVSEDGRMMSLPVRTSPSLQTARPRFSFLDRGKAVGQFRSLHGRDAVPRRGARGRLRRAAHDGGRSLDAGTEALTAPLESAAAAGKSAPVEFA